MSPRFKMPPAPPPRPALPIPDAVIACCITMGMRWETVAFAFKLSIRQVEEIVRVAVRKQPKGGRSR